MIETWIDMARLDGSFGWVGIANLPSTAAVAAYLPDAGFAEVFTAHDNRVTLGGQFFPNGTGTAVDGGYQVTGAWNFGSGTGHSEYVAAGFMPMVDGELVWVAEGIPELRVAIVPRADVRFTDGWHVQGLRAPAPTTTSSTTSSSPRIARSRSSPGRRTAGRHRRSAWGSCRSSRPATRPGRSASPAACSTTSASSP